MWSGGCEKSHCILRIKGFLMISWLQGLELLIMFGPNANNPCPSVQQCKVSAIDQVCKVDHRH